MITLKEVRELYPQYSDWSDAKLISRFEAATQIRVERPGDDTGKSLTPSGRPKWTENFYGDGEIDTVGEDVGAAIGSGSERGSATVAGLPGAIMNSIGMGLEKVGMGKFPDEDRFFGFPEATAAMNKATGALPEALSGVGTEYQPKYRAGKFAKTGADFLAGALVPGAKLGNLGRTVVAPAVVSETAGQLTEGTAIEPYARLGGAMFGGRTADFLENAMAGGKVPARHVAAVNALRARGVTPTAGQATDHNRMLYAEEGSNRGKALFEAADDSFTQAALNMTLPPALKEAVKLEPNAHPSVAVTQLADGIGNVMDGLAARNKVPINQPLVTQINKIANQYRRTVSMGSKTPFFRNMANDLEQYVSANASIKGSVFQQYRSQLSAMTKLDPITKEAAIGAMKVLDDAMEQSIKKTGNKTDLALYRESRQAYSNLLVVEKALGRSLEDMPVITPSALAIASRSKDLRAYVQGNTHFDKLFRAGKTVLKKPRDSGTSQRFSAQFGNAAPAMAAASTAALMGGGPEAAAAAGVLGISAAPFRSNVLSSRPVQKYMEMTARRGERPGPMTTPATVSGLREFYGR